MMPMLFPPLVEERIVTAEAFLADIAEHPANDLPRLVFADWLEDSGEAGRAEIIRIQVALARMPEDRPARPALQTRQRGLLLKHERDWSLGLRHLAESWQFHRGFVREVTVERTLTAEQFAELLRWPIVRRVVARHAWRLFPGLVHSPEAQTLEELRIANTELNDRQFRDLVECPHFERLHTLEVVNCGLNARSIRHLLRSPLLGRLRALVLSGNRIGDQAAAELVRSPHVGNLRLLDLSDCGVGQETVLAIKSAPLLGGLTTLRLDDNDFTDLDCAIVLGCPHLAGLHELTLSGADGRMWGTLHHFDFPYSLRRLSIWDARFGSSRLFELLASPRLTSLETLHLSGSVLFDGDAPESEATTLSPVPLDLDLSQLTGTPNALANLLLNTPALARARRLALPVSVDEYGDLSGDVLDALLHSPHLSGLRALAFAHCHDECDFSGEVLPALLGSELMKRLNALDLSACHLGDTDAIELAAHPHVANLTWLSLRGNFIGSRGAHALAESPYLGNLRRLDLSRNRIDDAGAEALAGAPHLISLVVLDLTENPIGRRGEAILLQAAQVQFERSVTIPYLDA
jgi:uncharacterized protein (TIGR02996 family)